jgi:8-oxo-dGTP pyrophosphatase MutT (NUDIX family)
MKADSSSSEYSAGGVVYRHNGAGTDIALIYRTRHDDWSLPKGHIEAGESREQAALREIKEETGLDARILHPLGEAVYFFRKKSGDLVRKTVYHYLMEALTTTLGKPNWEVTEARWVPIAEAQTLLSYEKDKEIVAKAIVELGNVKRET